MNTMGGGTRHSRRALEIETGLKQERHICIIGSSPEVPEVMM